jgi:ELWxxDGT repeat protein
MKKIYMLTILAALIMGVANAQIVQVTDINTTADAGIAKPFVHNGEIYFEADDGSDIADELYKIAADGTVSLVKNINADPDDTTPNSDPMNFIEYNGKLYFNANDGDVTGHDKELWVTDGTEAGTQMVADINPGLTLGSNPLSFCVFNGKLYFNAKFESSTQIWRYDGVNAPVKITTVRDDGYATPMFPSVDEANGVVYWKMNNGAYELGVLKADESFEVIDINSVDATSAHGFAGTEAGILLNGKMLFQGDDGSNGDELWITDGTIGGTTMLVDINTTAAGENSDPESFVAYDGKVLFVADAGTGLQLWETDGTAGGTKMVAEPFTGDDGDLDNLKVYNGKLYFSATDGTNGYELWVYDGTTASMLKDINQKIGEGDSDPEGFTEVDGLLFFEADDSTGVKLWVTDGTPEHTMRVAAALNSSFDPVKVNSAEFVALGTVLYFTADDANGHDEFYSVDANTLFSYGVTFAVTDEAGPLEGASVGFDETTATTDAEGMATFDYVRIGADLAYTVSLEDYETANGLVTVVDAAITEDVVLVALPTYNVSFTVTDGTNPLEGATVSFNEATGTTDASGVYIFAEVLPAADMAYTITMAGYEDVTGTATVVDQDISVDEAMTLIVYTVTFNVSDLDGAIEGATVTFGGSDMITDAGGSALFTDIAPGTGLAYSVTVDYRYYNVDGTVDVDGDEVVDVALALTGVDHSMISKINVYPNPSSGTVWIDGVEQGASYELFNISQQKIAEGILDGSQLELNTVPGLYIFKVNTNGETLINRLIIQ